MAQLSFSGLDELMLSMREIAEIPDEVQDEMLNAGADALIPEIKARGEGYGIGSGEQAEGILLESLTKSKVKQSQKKGRYITVYFKGSRIRGMDGEKKKPKRIKNSEIAFLNEYGTRHQIARPFVRDTIQMSEATVVREEAAVYNRWLESKGF